MIGDIEWIEVALDGIVPYNKERRPRGKWWAAFLEGASIRQRTALSAFLEYIRIFHWDSIGIANQVLLSEAEVIWPTLGGKS